MANFFDQFDEAPVAPAPRGPVAPPTGNYFDQFDDAAPASAGSAPGMGTALVRGAMQGATLNFGDELTATGEASGLPSWTAGLGAIRPAIGGARLLAERLAPSVFGTSATDAYTASVARERGADEAAQAAHPLAFTGASLGGALATAPIAPVLAPFRAAQGAGVIARGSAGAGNLAATGAVYGGAAGFGAGEGDLVERLPSAAGGAAVGAVAGPVIGGAMQGVRAGAGYVADNVAAMRDPGRLADRVVARNLERDAAGLPAIAAQMERANVTPGLTVYPPGGAAPVEIPRVVAGQQITAADLAGPNTQALAGTVARTAGPGRTAAREFLETRQVGTDTAPSQGERITRQLGAILGDDGAIATADSLIASRAAKSQPLYERAFAKPIDYRSAPGQRLDAMLDEIPNSARLRANELLTLEGRGGNQLVFGSTPDRNGLYPLRAVPDTRQWDYIRRALWDDALGSKGFGKEGEVSQYGAAVRQFIGRIDTSLNEAVPALRAARSVYKGDSDLLDALRAGQSAFHPTMSKEAVEKALKGLSPGEAELYRLGAANALRNRLANMPDGADKAKAAFGSPAIRDKIAAMMRGDPKGHGRFVEYLQNERRMFETRSRALGGSPTQERLADAADTGELAGELGGAAIHAATGRIGEALRSVWRTVQKVSPERRGRVLEEARKVLLNPDPEALRSFIRRVDSSRLTESQRRQIGAVIMKSVPRSVIEATIAAQ